MNTVESISEWLREHDVVHNELQSVPSAGVNGAYTDRRFVYCKHYRPGRFETHAVKDLQVASIMADFVPTVAPLVSEPLRLPDDSGVTVWPWLDMQPVSGKHFHEVSRIIDRVHSLPAPGFLRERDMDAMSAEVEDRFLSVEDSRFTRFRGLQTELLEGYRECADGIPLVFCHGDPHAENFGVVNGRVVVFDWEGAILGPREWDLALPLVEKRWVDNAVFPPNVFDISQDLLQVSVALRALSQVARHAMNGRFGEADLLLSTVQRYAPWDLAKHYFL